ncbi:unnamed protein product [Ambrosiozyma monospora]|uniref:Unnamed protein product n=1 Tax=Ambrosiozyma monospora TaxID=43982 RepID=A0ACB5T7E0_AMBMO|nr:unnamed protein product [Ambrosiozyma monospora]
MKKRGLSSGITVCGSGIGGCVMVLAGQKLITDTGDFKWGMRMNAIVAVVLLMICTALLKERVPRHRERSWKFFKQQCKIVFAFSVLKRWPVVAISLWFGFGIISYLVLTYSLAAFSTFIGLSQKSGAHITAIFNGCQAIGRPAIGYFGDKVGRINLALTLNIFIAIIVFAFWINCNNFITVLFFAIISGLTSGWCQLLNQAIMPDAVPIHLFPAAWGFENIIVGCFCLFVEVVALKLRDMTASKPFLHAQIFCGCMTIISFFFLVPVREYKVRRVLDKRLEETNSMIENLSNSSYSDSNNEKTTEHSAHEDASLELLNSRKERYDHLLRNTSSGYLARLFYPIIA